MNTKFTVEESNLISIFEDKSRKKVIHNIRDVREHLGDEEMVELVSRVLGKLDSISDVEFAELEFVAAD
jgi:hypothetical protein